MQLPIELKQAIDNNAFCALATKLNEKEIQNHLMWVDYKDNKILINTEQGRKKTENIRQEPNISLVIFHPTDMYTCWEIRGVVENIVQDYSANDHIDYLSNRYSGKPMVEQKMLLGSKQDSNPEKYGKLMSVRLYQWSVELRPNQNLSEILKKDFLQIICLSVVKIFLY